MRAKTKLKPGQDGAKSLLDRYGGQSLCVRHRYGGTCGLRHKTIELIAGTVPWSRWTAEIPSATISPSSIQILPKRILGRHFDQPSRPDGEPQLQTSL